MQHTITEHFTKYHPERLTFSERPDKALLGNGIIIRIKLKELPNGDRKTIFEIPGALKIETGVYRFPEALENMDFYREGECYDVYADANGNSPYIEAEIRLHQEYGEEKVRSMSLGLPLNLYNAAESEIYLLFDGVRFAWIANGEIVNINFPIGYIQAEDGDIFVSDNAEIGICSDIRSLESEEKTETKNESIAFYSARGYNAWAGDIVNFYHDGVYHFLVLLDRHHHGNRFGCGAHSTYHMTTNDFIHWENHGEIYPIQNQWESFGTGTMFFWNGKYYYSHGFHTDRVIPRDKVGSRLLEKNYEKDGFFSAVTYDELKENGLYPSGANYMVSDDGIHFTQGKKQVHCAENPSIYKDENGGLVMYAGYGAAGVWKAPNIDGPWRKDYTDMPVFDNSSPVRNSSECPSIFEWNGYKYIIMGFTGYWQSGYKDNNFADLAAIGDDIYDGLGVPMVANCGGRYILAGWVRGIGWASVTQHRELIQHEGGRLGIRWLPELTPNPDMLEKAAALKTVKSGTELAMNGRTSYYLECTVTPEKNARVEIALTGSGAPCALELFTEKQKVQITKAVNTDEFQPEIRALYEYIPELPQERTNYLQIPSEDIHMYGHDFAIANVREIKEKYVLKMMIHYEKKSDNTVIDAEIGGGRTIISNRIYFKADKIKILSENAEITDLKLCKMGE